MFLTGDDSRAWKRCQEIHHPRELGDTDQRRTESWLQTYSTPTFKAIRVFSAWQFTLFCEAVSVPGLLDNVIDAYRLLHVQPPHLRKPLIRLQEPVARD